MKSLQGQIVLITEAGHSTGRHLALECARVGARLVLWASDISQADRVAGQLYNQFGTLVRCYQVGFAQPDASHQIQSAAQAVLRDFPRIDVILLNFDVFQPKAFMDDESTNQQIQRNLQVNLMATLWTTRAFLPRMLDNNHGHLVMWGTCADLLGAPKLVDYCTAKAGIHGLCNALRDELRGLQKPCRVQLTLVCPALITNKEDLTPAQEACNQRVLVGRVWVTPQEVARQTVRAMRKNQDQITIPISLALFGRLANAVSLSVRNWLLDQTKLSKSFDS